MSDSIFQANSLREARLIDQPDYAKVAEYLDVPGFLATVADDPIEARCQLDRAVERWAADTVRRESEARRQAAVDALREQFLDATG